MATKHVNEANFDKEVLKSSVPVLVDFWAEWCGPCRMLGPVVEELSNEYAGKLVVAKVNVDENQDISEQHGIRSIPTMLLFKNGKVVDQSVGFLPKTAIKSWLDRHIK